MDNKKIGKLIATLRKEKRLTQQELGDKVGVGSRAVSKWECGITVPDISIINELSNILEISPKELLSGKQTNTKIINTKRKLTNKTKILIISIIVLIISIISLTIYYNNKTYIYRISEVDYENYKIEGYALYKQGTLSIYINNFDFNDSKYMNYKFKDYHYYLKIENNVILGYGKTQELINTPKNYQISDIENILKITYIGKTKISRKEILKKNIYIELTLWNEDNQEKFYNIELSLYEKEN